LEGRLESLEDAGHIGAIRLAGRIDEYVANYSLVGRWAWEYRLQLIGFPDEADLHIQCVVLN